MIVCFPLAIYSCMGPIQIRQLNLIRAVVLQNTCITVREGPRKRGSSKSTSQCSSPTLGEEGRENIKELRI
jgi:hypothetical protein